MPSALPKMNISIDVLSELTDQDLQKLGVLLGHRRRIRRAIREQGGDAFNSHD
jgi:hypothetical protein